MRRGVLAAMTAVLLLAACTGGSSPLRAAEPSKAPSPSVAPAGAVRPIGQFPQGIVYDPTTKDLAVAVRNPDRLLLVDTATMRVRRSFPLPGGARHLQLEAPGGPVLVPDETSGQLLEVALPKGPTSAIKVGNHPHDAAGVGNGEVVVGNELGKSISFVKGDRVLQTVHDVQQPGGVIGDGNTVAIVDVGKFTVSTYDVATRKRTAIVNAGAGPTHGVLLSGGRIAVADTRGNAILVFSLHPLKQIGRLALPGTPYGVAIDPTTDTMWVTLTALNQVVGLNMAADNPRVIARYPTVQQPDTVAVAPGSGTIWITGTHAGQLQTITR